MQKNKISNSLDFLVPTNFNSTISLYKAEWYRDVYYT
jgi:hypothetical protein